MEELKETLLQKAGKMDQLLQEAAKVLANSTEYAAMISSPQLHKNKLKFIKLSRVDAAHLLVVVVREGNLIKNTIIRVAEELTEESVLKLNILLNTHLNGLAMEEINLAMITALKQQAGIHSDIVSEVIDAVAEAIQTDEELKIYTSGAKNIFKYPELADHEKASELVSTFEEKRGLNELVMETLAGENENGIQVFIGEEAPVEGMKDCSVVTATYELEEGMKGTIGIIGPKRMDYDKVVGTLKSVMHQLDEIYKEKP